MTSANEPEDTRKNAAQAIPLTKQPSDQPAFGIIVYVKRTDAGQTQARVANLESIVAIGNNERDVLGKIVASCKKILADAAANGETPSLLDPPHPKEDDEQRRFLPMHL